MDLSTLAGQQLGQYELIEVIGTGGMSAVYRANQPSLNRNVAVKVLSSELANDPSYAKRFDTEAKTVATLEHNNIIPVYDYGTENGLSFIVMRLLTGGTLGERIEYRIDHDQPLPAYEEAVTLLKELTKALSYAHTRGVIHRDIKASNVMFDTQGDPYLVDFGIAQVMKSNMALTADNQTIGTPTYMAPEQWRDEELTPATDQYALGVLMYYTLTGRLPFYGSNAPALMQKHLNELPPPPHILREGMPEQVTMVLQRALSKEPENRYANVQAFSDSFSAALRGESTEPTGFFTFSLSGGEQTAAHRATTMESEREPMQETAPRPPEDMTLPNEKSETAPQPAVPTVPAPKSSSQAPAAMPVPPQAPPAPRVEATAPRNSLLKGVGIGLAIVGVLAVIMVIVLMNLSGSSTEPPTPTTQPTESVVAATDNPSQSGGIRINPSPGQGDMTAITPVRGGTAVAANPVEVSGSGILYEGEASNVVRAVDVSANGVVISGHADGSIRMWLNGTGGQPMVLRQHNDVVNDIDSSADGSVMISGSNDNSVRVWDGITGEYRGLLGGHTAAVRGVAVSPDGTLAASAAQDNTVRLWDVSGGSEITVLRQGSSRFLSVAFSDDGSLIAAGDESGSIYLFNVDSRSLLRTLRGHTESVRSLDFNADGSQLVSASTDDTVRLWEVDSGTIIATLRGHGTDVWRVTFSPDGSTVASGGRDNTLRLWDVASQREITALTGHSGWVLGVAFTPDGSTIATGGGDGAVRLWNVESN